MEPWKDLQPTNPVCLKLNSLDDNKIRDNTNLTWHCSLEINYAPKDLTCLNLLPVFDALLAIAPTVTFC